MAKSVSTRNPPSKVWLVFDSESRLVDWANHRLGIAKSDEQAHQYTPLQKPLRCVWEKEERWIRTSCNRCLASRADYEFCPYCGGRIHRTQEVLMAKRKSTPAPTRGRA